MAGLVATKATFMALVFAEALAGGALPLFFHHFQALSKALPYAHAFSGGVFLASALVHLVPHAIEAQGPVLEMYREKHEYPIAMIVIVGGFLLVLFFEKVLIHPHGHEIPMGEGASDSADECHLRHASPRPRHEHGVAPAADGNVGALEVHIDGLELLHQRVFKLRHALLMLATLGVHSVLAGIALGLQDSKRSTRDIFIAICSHKAVSALALGIQLYRHGATTLENLSAITFFAFLTPVGIAIGLGIPTEDHMASFVFEALGAGAFLYVGACEVTGDLFETAEQRCDDNGSERDSLNPHTHPTHGTVSRSSRVLRFLVIVLGCALMIGLQFAAPHEHEDGHEHRR